MQLNVKLRVKSPTVIVHEEHDNKGNRLKKFESVHLREDVEENDIFLKETDELLVLRDLLVNRFGTGKIAP